MRITAIVNQKGGCGKTTTAINLAAVYARRGLRTLIVDMDPQSHCAAGLGVPEKRIDLSIAEAMLAGDDPAALDPQRLIWEVARNLYLAPSTMRLAALEAPGGGLHELPDKDCRLQSVLTRIGDDYDRCLIDCPPTIGLLTFNAMRAAREALIPVETGYFAMKGAEKQWQTIQQVIRRIGRPIACHIVPTLYDEDSELACDILASLRKRFAGQIVPLVIRCRSELREAASMGQAVIEHAPESDGHRDYESLADWLEEHPSSPGVEIETFLTVENEGDNDAGRADDGEPAQAFIPGIRSPAKRERGEGAGEPVSVRPSPLAANDADRGRAAELVERLRTLTLQAAAHGIGEVKPDEPHPIPASIAALTESTTTAIVKSISPHRSEFGERRSGPLVELDLARRSATRDNNIAKPDASVSHLYGVRVTTGGVLFVQPAVAGDRIFIAGDFNGWSPLATPMRRNPELGVFELLIKISPGHHQYRLVIDGKWQRDPYNAATTTNEHGEPNSLIIIPPPSATNSPPTPPLIPAAETLP